MELKNFRIQNYVSAGKNIFAPIPIDFQLFNSRKLAKTECLQFNPLERMAPTMAWGVYTQHHFLSFANQAQLDSFFGLRCATLLEMRQTLG
jgi:hypothetical protein